MTAAESGHVDVFRLDGERILQIAAGDGVLAMRNSTIKSNCFATGGRENPLKLWDVNSPDKPLFTAKNVVYLLNYIIELCVL